MIEQDGKIAVNTESATMDDYDSPWKEAVEHYFTEFMDFYFPDAHEQIDWSKEYVFLDQELRAIAQDAELGKRYVDKLVRVTLLNGDEKWIYIHIEVQGTKQTEFAKRMFVYNYRIYDRYDKPVASMAVLADEYADWKPSCFEFEVLGCKHRLEFPIAKLTEYHERLNELQILENSFAIVTAAHILTQRTRKNDYDRYEAKQLLVRILYQRNWTKQRVIDLFRVIDWMMKLPESLEQQLWHEIEILEENEKMQYVTSIERMAIAKGREEGLEKGREEGALEAEKKTLQRQLQHRFQVIPDWAVVRILQGSEAELEQWLDNVLDAATLDSVFTKQTSSH
ncbi:MAG: cytosolic protein [Methylomonas sp.]|jgi:predicted transposase/invertase (TIGR01784 family)